MSLVNKKSKKKKLGKANSKAKASIRNSIGIVGIGDGVLVKSDGTRYMFYRIQPSNLAVLSEVNVHSKIQNLSALMQASGQIEMFAMDGKENYASNRAFISNRIKEEKNPKLKDILKKELRYIKEIESETSTARSFMVVLKMRKGNERQSELELERFQQIASQSMISISRLTKDEMKEMLSIYFAHDTNPIDDFDGISYFDDVDFEEMAEKINSGELNAPVATFNLRKEGRQ